MPVFSAVIGANAAKKSAKVQENASNKALALQEKQFNKTESNFAPYLAAGNSALSMYMNGIGLNGDAGKSTALTAFRDTNPAYNWQLEQGTRARDMGAAARGGLYTGGQIKELQQFGQGLADSTYGTWLDRVNGVSVQGSNAAGQLGTIGTNYANSAGQNIVDAGNARASGIMGAANAYMGGISQLSQLAGNVFGFGGGPSSYVKGAGASSILAGLRG